MGSSRYTYFGFSGRLALIPFDPPVIVGSSPCPNAVGSARDFSGTRRKARLVSRRPQGAFVAGGARRRRLSWSRPPTAQRWRFARTRNGAWMGATRVVGERVRRFARTRNGAARAVHESPLARDAKASKPFVEARKRFAHSRREGA